MEFLDWYPEAIRKQIVDKSPNLTFATLVETILEAKGISQKDLALKVAYSERQIRRFLTPNQVPSKAQVIAIGVALEMDLKHISHLLNLEGYLLSRNNDIDRIYIDMFNDVGEKKRIDDYNIFLKRKKVKKKYLLGNC